MRQLFAIIFILVSALGFGAEGVHRKSPYLSYIVMDADSSAVLGCSNATKEAYPASCTKLMTARLVYKARKLGRITDSTRFVQSKRSKQESPSKLDLAVGESISYDDAMKALFLKSANDVAVMMAEKVGGSVENFVELMNLEAKKLGMKHTRYVSPNGLPPPKNSKRGFDVSTAQDLAILAQALVRENPEILDYTSLANTTITGAGGQPLWLQNHNNILWKKQYKVKGADGLKTGYNNAGGSSIVLTGRRDGGHRVIVVVLGSSSAAERDANAAHFLEDALMRF